MIYTDEEMKSIRRSLESQSAMLPELEERCGELIRRNNFEEAIRNGFVLLEETLRTAVNDKKRRTGTKLAHYAFHPETGPLVQHLPPNSSEREGLRGLFTGAFLLLRNPSAHNYIEYDPSEARSILYFINLLLILLKQASNVPPRGFFPENVENNLSIVETELGSDVASRLRIFFGKCIKLGFRNVKAKQWIPFRSDALQKRPGWEEPRIFHIPIFYFYVESPKKMGLWFPVNQYYSMVIGYDIDPVSTQLADLGFIPKGKYRDFLVDLEQRNDQQFFDELFQIVKRINSKMNETL